MRGWVAQAGTAPAAPTGTARLVGWMQPPENGGLVDDDPRDDVLPELANPRVLGGNGETRPPPSPPTLRQLLSHSSGYGHEALNPELQAYNARHGVAAVPETPEQLGQVPLMFDPGTRWNYSLGFDVTGLAIEAVTGRRLGEQLAADVFAPLGMRDTAFHVPPEKVDRLAHVLPLNPETGKPQRIRDPVERPKFDCGGGCLVSSAADYLRFAQMLANGGELDEATQILLNLRETNPDGIEVNYRLARVAAKQQRTDDAIGYYNHALYGIPRGGIPIERYRIRIELVDLLLDTASPDAPDELNVLVRELPDTADAHAAAAALAARVPNRALALAEYTKAATLAAHDPAPALAAGRLAVTLGDFDAAGRMLASTDAWPNWVKGDEFRAARDKSRPAK